MAVAALAVLFPSSVGAAGARSAAPRARARVEQPLANEVPRAAHSAPALLSERSETRPASSQRDEAHADWIEIAVVDERGAAVSEVEVQTCAHGADAWSASPDHVLFDGSKLRLPRALFDAQRVRIGAPWRVWTEFEPTHGACVCVLEPAGSLRAIVRNSDASTGARWRLWSPTAEFRAPADGEVTLFERLRPANYRLELSTPAAGAVENLEVLIEPGRTQRAHATLPPAGDLRPATLTVTLSGAEFDALNQATRLVLQLAPHPSEDDGSDRFRRPVENALNGSWSTRFVGLMPGARSLALDPLGIQRSVELHPAQDAELRIELDGLARTAVSFHRSTTGAAFAPREVHASLVAGASHTHVTPTLSTDGSLTHVFYTSPGELVLTCSDEGWAAPATRLQVVAGWNSAVLEAVPAGRVTLRAPRHAPEAAGDFWSRVEVRHADMSTGEFGRRLRAAARDTGAALELTVPADRTLEIVTPPTAGLPAQQFRVKVAAGERLERELLAD